MTTAKEKILQKLNPKFLKLTPKLSGDVGSFVDLDSDDSLVSGAKELMIRFYKNQDLCEKNKRNSVQSEMELTISSAKYNEKNEICELITERLNLPVGNNDRDVACEKPGRRLQKLKMELQEKMSAKWEEEYKKRVSENKSYCETKHKHKTKCAKDYEDVGEKKDKNEKDMVDAHDSSLDETSQLEYKEEELKDENLEDDSDEADVEFENDDDGEISDSNVPSIVNEDKELSDCDIDQSNSLDKDDDYESYSLIPAYQPGGGMLYGGSELTQCDEGLPQGLLSPSLRFSITESSESKIPEILNEQTPKKPEDNQSVESENLFTVKMKLFSQNPNEPFDLHDAFEFCSGKFPDAENKPEMKEESQYLVKDNAIENGNVNDDDVYVDNFENSQMKEDNEPELKKQNSKNKKFQNIIVFDESEEEEEVIKEQDEVEESQSAPLKILSDDEEESDEKQKTKRNKLRKSLHFSDDEDASNDFKEEENEISDCELDEERDDQRSVHYDSEENEINPKEFFEKEAELSGSEWSGDEDERGLDEFDVEEGDADCLDEDQVRSQLEKIHIRRVLDDDAREVRLIQEILFEDGDLYSDGKRRDRKFKWKNLGAFEQHGDDGAKEEGGNDSEDDGGEEEELRKMRHEKELFLMAKKKNGELSSDDEIVEDFHCVKVTTVKNSFKLPAKSENKMGNSESIAIVTDIAKTTSFSNTRGSFLKRNEEFLTKLAKTSSSVTDNVLGPKNSKYFVFTVKSPEKENSERNVISKRQVENPETCNRLEKKIKLLPPEINTEPSILDLLV